MENQDGFMKCIYVLMKSVDDIKEHNLSMISVDLFESILISARDGYLSGIKIEGNNK